MPRRILVFNSKLLKTDDKVAQKLIAQGIWLLAFQCKAFIMQEPACVKGQTNTSVYGLLQFQTGRGKYLKRTA